VSAVILDPAHVAEQTSPTPGRNFLIAGLAGLAAGVAAALALGRGVAVPLRADAVDRGAERRLRARIDEVAKRERALAKRAGELAVRERALERAETAPPSPEPAPTPSAPRVSGRFRDGWNLRDLEALVRERTDAGQAQQDEWAAYLFFLREHADADGNLPASFDSLLDDVFGDVARVEGPRAAGPP